MASPPAICILIPVLGRPERIAAVAASAIEARTVATEIVVLCSPGDEASRVAALDDPDVDSVIVVPWPADRGDYAKKINLGARNTEADHVFHGGDDLRFELGWDTAALASMSNPNVHVVGTNDLGNRMVMQGRHSTHSLVRRSYAMEHGTTFLDGPGFVLHEGYDHQHVDVELVEAAQHRGGWAFARYAVVEHLHPFWGKGEMDDTYRKAQRDSRGDQRIYMQRKRQWLREGRP